MALWWQPGDDTAGLVSRSERVAGTMRDLLGDEAQELYLLSSKVIAKEPEEGGAFAWHQVLGENLDPKQDFSVGHLCCVICHTHSLLLPSGLWIFLRERCFVSRLRLCEPGSAPVSQASFAINPNIRPHCSRDKTENLNGI